MSLIICKECGNQMSDRATECPHCGCPIEICRGTEKPSDNLPLQKPKKIGKYAIIGLLTIIVLCVGAYLCIKNEVFASSTLKITPEFTKALKRYDQIDAFSEGLAAVRREGKWGYINLKGEEVIPCQFSDDYKVGQFSEGVACVVDTRNNSDSALWNKRVGFINKKGEWVLDGDFFTEAHCPYAPMESYADCLPSFKDGKVAVWDMPSTYAEWDDWSEKSKIVLVDHKGKTYEVSDSIGKELSTYQPYPKISTAKPKRIEAYNDYFINEYRDTLQCDNGARFVSWCIIDENNFPYNTKDKSVGYYIDNYGNSTLTYAEKEAMEQHLNGLVAHLADQHNERLRRQAEEKRLNALREHPEKLFESLARNHIWHAFGCAKLSSLRYNCEYVISFRPETERSGQCSYITWEDNGKHNTYSAAFSSDYCNYVIKGDIIEFYWRVKKWTDHYQIIFDENTEGIILKDLSSSLGQFTMIPKTKELIPKSFEY